MSDGEHNSELAIDGTGDEEERVPIFSQLTILGVVLFLLLGAGITPKIIALLNPATTPSAVAETLPPLQAGSPDETAFADIALEAEAAFVWDIRNQRALYQHNPDTQLPLASVTKLMTALVANELLSADTIITISDDAVNQDGNSGLRAGEQFTLRNLSDLTLLSSSNDGAYAVAETLGSKFDESAGAEAFVALMNIRADELALSQTYFRNPTGLDITETEAGAYGSARDMAFLMEYIVENQPLLLESTTDLTEQINSQNGSVHTARNTNPQVRTIPGIIGSKTGYTVLAGGNLVVAFDAGVNRPMVAVVLNSSWHGRLTDMSKLVAATISALQ